VVAFTGAVAIRPDGGGDLFLLDVHVNEDVQRFPADDVRRIVIRGGAGDDRIDVSPFSFSKPGPRTSVTIDGGDGNDTLTGGASVRNFIIGGRGNDTITGSAAPVRLVGGPGDDTVFARHNDGDLVIGGSGNDQAQINPSSPRLIVGDRVRGVEVLLP
jgi:Ca2+-binding RTX toxin-like protein